MSYLQNIKKKINRYMTGLGKNRNVVHETMFSEQNHENPMGISNIVIKLGKKKHKIYVY